MSFLFSQPAPGIVPIDSISFAELAKVDASSVLGNPSGSLADASSITFQDLTQNNLTLFSDTEQGLVPASGGGTSTFLRADGSWATAGISTAGALDQQVLAYDSGTGLTTWQYAGLGDGSFPANTVILGRNLPSGFTNTGVVLIGDGANTGGTAGYIRSVGIGWNSTVGSQSVSIGALSTSGNSSVAIGVSASTTNGDVAIGHGAIGRGSSVAIAASAAPNSIAIGTGIGYATGADYDVAVGTNIIPGAGTRNTIVGYGSRAGQVTSGAGSNNSLFGALSGVALTTGANNTILGQGSATALTTGTSNVIIGKGTANNVITETNSVYIGSGANIWSNPGNSNVCIGYNSLTDRNAVAVGSTASAAIGGVAIGDASSCGFTSVAIGQGAVAGNGIAIGAGSKGNNGNIAIAGAVFNSLASNSLFLKGDNTVVSGNKKMFVGSRRRFLDQDIEEAYFGQGGFGSDGNAFLHDFRMTVTPVNGLNESATNGTFTISGAQSTGTGVGGDIIFNTSPAGPSGSTPNAYIEVMRVTADSKVGIGTSTPGDKLTVQGTITYTDGASDYKISPKHWDHGTHTGTITVNFSQSPVQTVTLNAAGPLTINLNNVIDGGAYALRIIQGATPGTLSWPANVKWPGGTPPTLSTTTGDIDIVNFLYIDDGGGSTTLYGTFALDFA